jgi:hypothetical protein
MKATDRTRRKKEKSFSAIDLFYFLFRFSRLGPVHTPTTPPWRRGRLVEQSLAPSIGTRFQDLGPLRQPGCRKSVCVFSILPQVAAPLFQG